MFILVYYTRHFIFFTKEHCEQGFSSREDADAFAHSVPNIISFYILRG